MFRAHSIRAASKPPAPTSRASCGSVLLRRIHHERALRRARFHAQRLHGKSARSGRPRTEGRGASARGGRLRAGRHRFRRRCAIRFRRARALRLARAAERSGTAVLALAANRVCGTFAALTLSMSSCARVSAATPQRRAGAVRWPSHRGLGGAQQARRVRRIARNSLPRSIHFRIRLRATRVIRNQPRTLSPSPVEKAAGRPDAAVS